MRAPIGFVGVGNMGSGMATRALREGSAVAVCDSNPAATERMASEGAEIAASAAELAARCDLISVVVNYDSQVRDSMLGQAGVLAGAREGTIVAIHSTIHLATLEEVAAAAAQRSVTVVEAAVTGGPAAALRGELAVMLGGDAESIERFRPALETYASLVLHLGSLGAGMAAKLALNLISFVKLAATHEGIALARAAGIDLSDFARIVAHSEAQSGLHDWFLRERVGAYADDYAGPMREVGPHESPKSQKDLHAAMELALRHGLELPVTTVAHDAMPQTWAIERGLHPATLEVLASESGKKD